MPEKMAPVGFTISGYLKRKTTTDGLPADQESEGRGILHEFPGFLL